MVKVWCGKVQKALTGGRKDKIMSYSSVTWVTRKFTNDHHTHIFGFCFVLFCFFANVQGTTVYISFISLLSDTSHFLHPSISLRILTGDRWCTQIRQLKKGYFTVGLFIEMWTGVWKDHRGWMTRGLWQRSFTPSLRGEGATCLERVWWRRSPWEE
jgi:hypothetical protein